MPPIMSKPSTTALKTLTLALLTARASAQCTAGVVSTVTGDCTPQAFKDGLVTGCTDAELFPTYIDENGAEQATTQEIRDEMIADICRYDAPTQFVEIQGTYQLDRRFMDGGGPLIDSQEPFDVEVGRILRFKDNAAPTHQIAWPEYAALLEYNDVNGLGDHGYPPNFDLENSCDLNTVMCCFIDDVDGVGFAAGDSTTDVCRHDIGESPKSNHIKDGWSVFPGDETPTHCVGFTFTDGDKFMGNALFDVSLGTTASKEYIKSVPGAPLCACIEQMPIVETAACRKATGGTITYTFEYDPETGVTADNTVTDGVTYADCDDNRDLKAEVEFVHGPDTKIGDYLVGTGGCAAHNSAYLNDVQFLVPGQHPTKYQTIDEAEWAFVVGEGIRFLPPPIDPVVADGAFRALIDGGCVDAASQPRNCIIRRVCDSCTSEVHRDIYYVRHTEIPAHEDLYFLDLFMNNWVSLNNTMGVDFDLYSTYDDAIAGTNAWTKCNYDDPTIGFPRDCGPTWTVGNQWNSYVRRSNHGSATDHGFYVEKP